MPPEEFPRSRIAVPLAALALLTVLGLALWVRADPASPPFQGLDDAWLRLMDGPHEGPPWAVAEGFDRGGGRIAAVAVLVFALVLTLMRRWRSALFALTAFLASHLVTDALKYIGDRPRPEGVMVEVASPAFPSDHSSRVACLVVVIAAVAVPLAARRWWWPLGALLVLGMMWARTWQHAHWLTDTFGGVATGLGVAVLCWWAFGPMLRRERLQHESDDMARIRDARSGTNGLRWDRPPDRPRGRPMSPETPTEPPQRPGVPPPPPIPPYPPMYGYPYPPIPPRPYNGMAITAMIVGIVGACNPIGILGLIFGTIARRQIRETGEQGDGFAVAGIVLGWIGVASVVFWILYALLVVSFWIPFVEGVTDPSNWPTSEPSELPT